MKSRLFKDDNLRIVSILSIVGICIVIIRLILVSSSNAKHVNNLISNGITSSHWWVTDTRHAPGIPGKSQGYIDLTIKYEIKGRSVLESSVALLPWDYEDYRKNINNYDSQYYKQQKVLYLPTDPNKILLFPYQKIRHGEYLGGKILFYTGIVLTLIGLIVPFGVCAY